MTEYHMKNPTFNSGFLKKIPNIEIKVESSILKIYKKSAINITLTAENLYAFPLRSAIKSVWSHHSTFTCACWSSGM